MCANTIGFSSLEKRLLYCKIREADPLTKAVCVLLLDVVRRGVTKWPEEILKTNPYAREYAHKINQEEITCLFEIRENWNCVINNIERNDWQKLARMTFFQKDMDAYKANRILKELLKEEDIRKIYEFMIHRPHFAKMLLENDKEHQMYRWRERHPGRRETGYYFRGIVESYDSICAFAPMNVARDKNGQFDPDAWDKLFIGNKITTAVVGVILDGDNARSLFMPGRKRDEILSCVQKNDWQTLCDKYFPTELTPQQSVPLEQALEKFEPSEFSEFFSYKLAIGRSIGSVVVRAEPALKIPVQKMAMNYVRRMVLKTGNKFRENNFGTGGKQRS